MATFTVPTPNRASGDFTVKIVWGDGSKPRAGVVTDKGGGVFAVSGSHRYRRAGRFPVVVLISDAQGGHAFSLGTAVVHRGARVSIRRRPSPPTSPIAAGDVPVVGRDRQGLARAGTRRARRRTGVPALDLKSGIRS